MVKSLGFALYMAFSNYAVSYAERLLERRLNAGKEDPVRIGERRGRASVNRPNGKLLWFHAASVGEALSIQSLVRRLGDENPAVSFLLTTGTRTSADVMASRLPPCTIHQYIPLDVLTFVREFLDHWQPDVAIWTESEFWPALMAETDRRGIPMLLINARMSARSYTRWRCLPGFAASLLRKFRFALVQDEITAHYLGRLGMPHNRMRITGTLKESAAALPCDESERDQIARSLRGRPVWLAASTHEGEEVLVARAHRIAMRVSHRLLLIVAPRHPGRGPDIARAFSDDGWSVALRTANEGIKPDTEIYVADTVGEMGLWYRLAPISFMGGSFVEIGGHNPFEPAALGSAILHGPHVTNFQDIFERLAKAEAAQLVRSEKELGEGVQKLLSPDKAARMAHAAWEVCSSGADVTDQAVQLILSTLKAAA